MKPKFTLTIRGSQASTLLRNHIDELFTGLVESSPLFPIARFHVSLSVENGPAAPGPDRYACSLIVQLKDGGTIRMREESGSLYDASTDCFIAIRHALLERKRDRVDRRNDRPRGFRGGQGGVG